ncbi:hypothetical protein [Anaerotignum sp. MB30-C6]|uniref:hypothetical protein n=1 Tax=Anaerotignum sp. MB30-C6 TaxID=3070814 RepID=UPI0027DCB266|nr:hypothetical protein [Anaerotignum sp. MB30-C6]WMI80107.1 hypothetical protein RBQ60_09690 [Anaerotignum sp. MB30-C6]
MRKYYPIFASICISLLIGGCTKKELQTNKPVDNIFISNGAVTTPVKSEKVIKAKIIKMQENTILVADNEEEHGLYQVTLGKSMGDISQFSPGNLIEIGFDGLVLESYPAVIANPDYIRFLETSDDFVGLYHNIFIKLFETDSALNSDIDFIALDLTEDEILTPSEKNALLYLFWSATQIETRLATFEDLLSENLITVDDSTGFAHLDTSILFSMETSELDDASFKFTAEKWRSSLGSYVFYDCIARKNNGVWDYEIGSEMIS